MYILPSVLEELLRDSDVEGDEIPEVQLRRCNGNTVLTPDRCADAEHDVEDHAIILKMLRGRD